MEIFIFVSLLVILSLVLVIGLIFLIQGPPYVPSDDESTGQIVGMVKKYKGKRILDIGSGDGKLVLSLARNGFTVDGIEINPLLVLRSRKAIKEAGLESRAKIRWGNFWSYKTANYDMIVCYMIKHIMPSLEKKLRSELRPGSYVVSNYFVFPKSQPIERKTRVRVYKI